MLIAADDALESAAARTTLYWGPILDNKFRKAINLLHGFSKDFPHKDPTSDPIIGGTAGKANVSDKSKSPTAILQALKNNLLSNVKFPSVYLSLNADES